MARILCAILAMLLFPFAIISVIACIIWVIAIIKFYWEGITMKRNYKKLAKMYIDGLDDGVENVDYFRELVKTKEESKEESKEAKEAYQEALIAKLLYYQHRINRRKHELFKEVINHIIKGDKNG